MYKYKIYDDDWYQLVYERGMKKKIDRYVSSLLDKDVQCDELCESRDSCDDQMFDRNELHIFIEILYTL